MILAIALSAHFAPEFFETKKRRRGLLLFYGRFLRTTNVTTKHRTIATIMAAIAGMKYCSTTEACSSSAGVEVACGVSTLNDVTALDGQYASLPVNEA